MCCVVMTADKYISHKHIVVTQCTDHVSQMNSEIANNCKVLRNTEQQSSILYDKTHFFFLK